MVFHFLKAMHYLEGITSPLANAGTAHSASLGVFVRKRDGLMDKGWAQEFAAAHEFLHFILSSDLTENGNLILRPRNHLKHAKP